MPHGSRKRGALLLHRAISPNWYRQMATDATAGADL